MSVLRLNLGAVAAVVQRDLRIALSYRIPFVTQILSAFFTLTLFYYLSRLVNVRAFETADAYYAFAVIGLISLQIITATLLTAPQALRQELVAGTFERVVASPFGPVGTAMAMMIFPFLSSLATALVMVAFAGVVFGVDVAWGTLALAPPLAVLAAASFAPFGLMLLSVVVVAKQVMAGATWIVAAIALVSGLYFPTTLLPDWVEWASEVQPFTPAVDLLRHVIVDTPLQDALWLDLARLVGFASVLMPLAVIGLGRAIRVSRRRGTLIEY